MRLFICTDPLPAVQEAMVVPSTGTKGFVLLLEDNEDDAYFLQRAWKARGLPEAVSRVENGVQAKQLLLNQLTAASNPRLIITDLKMPECDGFEFVRWLRSQPTLQGIKCVVLSSSHESRDMFEAKLSGADGFFTKPSNSKAYADLIGNIAVHLGHEAVLKSQQNQQSSILRCN